MHADFSVELGRDDAALELPWSSADPAVRYYDLKNNPELLREIPEAVAYPELGTFLARINAAGFPLATAKCDAWLNSEVAPEEEIFGDRKFVSYVDLVFEDETQRCSVEKHEAFAKNLCRLLSQTPEIPAAVEIVIRRCFYHGEALSEIADPAEKAGADVEEIDGEGLTDETAAEAEARGGNGEAVEAGNEVEARSGLEVEGPAEERRVAEQQSGAANRRCEGRSSASERTWQGADVGHRMEDEDADAGDRSMADIEELEPTERLDETVADERIVLNSAGVAVSGFSFTAYVTGFGDSEHEPRLRWEIALALLQNALVQLAR